jgi:hypothetical protein
MHSKPSSRLIHPHASHGSTRFRIRAVAPVGLAVARGSPAMIHPAHAMGVFRADERFERDNGRDNGRSMASGPAGRGSRRSRSPLGAPPVN